MSNLHQSISLGDCDLCIEELHDLHDWIQEKYPEGSDAGVVIATVGPEPTCWGYSTPVTIHMGLQHTVCTYYETRRTLMFDEATCRVCGCTDDNCYECYVRTGDPCYWVEVDLCSACATRGSPAGSDGDRFPGNASIPVPARAINPVTNYFFGGRYSFQSLQAS